MECKETLKGQMDLIASDVSQIRQDLDGFKDRVSEVENRVSTLEDSKKSDSRELQALQQQVKQLQERANETENRLRRNNVHILSLPESAEETNSTKFAEQLLIKVWVVYHPPLWRSRHTGSH